ncbi:MAG: CoA transferase [Verrucomicrobia bacterium]|nr:CoA transferase [Verrucomicrobiota bacterium]MCH8511445.1 CoA transferase [Kiritimatiellia bacterium]
MQALDNITILDFTQLLQGPYATQMLGDLGAEVIKIEKPHTGDLYRSMTFFNQWIGEGESPCFLPWNRNKRSLALDLKAPVAKEILYKLAETADVVVENFRPGVMEKLGLGHEDFRAINPRIIYASATGWGKDGPYAKRPGQDLLVQGLSGAVFASGKKSEGPVAIGTALSDQLGALHLSQAILAALYARERNGKGQRIEVNLLQSVLAFEMQDFFTVQNLGRSFERPESGIAHPGNGAPFGIYRTADGWLSIAMNPWSKIKAALKDLRLAAYEDPQVLFDRRDEIYGVLQDCIRTKTTGEWLDIMLGLDIWCAPALELKDVGDDPQVKHLEAFTEIDHPRAGRVKITNIPFQMSETPGSIRRPAPLVGQHGREILGELGWDAEAIAELERAGTLTVQEVNA